MGWAGLEPAHFEKNIKVRGDGLKMCGGWKYLKIQTQSISPRTNFHFSMITFCVIYILMKQCKGHRYINFYLDDCFAILRLGRNSRKYSNLITT